MSRIGKVAVAVTTTLLIERFHVSQIVFAGTAGAVAPELKVGDVDVYKRQSYSFRQILWHFLYTAKVSGHFLFLPHILPRISHKIHAKHAKDFQHIS